MPGVASRWKGDHEGFVGVDLYEGGHAAAIAGRTFCVFRQET